MCRRASPRSASPSSAISRRPSTAGAATPACGSTPNEGVILAAAAGAVGVQLGGGAAPGVTPDRSQDLRGRGAARKRRPRRRLDARRPAEARPPAQRRRPGLALGRAVDAAAGAAVARQPRRLVGATSARRQLVEDLAVDAVARLADLAARDRREHAAAGLVPVRAVVEAAALACARGRASARQLRAASIWCSPNSWKPGESISAVVRAASSQYHCVVVVVCRPELSACEISPICAPASATSRLISVLLPAPLGPSTSVAWPASSGASAARRRPGRLQRHLAAPRSPSRVGRRGAPRARRSPAGRSCSARCAPGSRRSRPRSARAPAAIR